MKTKQLLKFCEKCLCNTCGNTDCKESMCFICEMEFPIEECEGYKGEE